MAQPTAYSPETNFTDFQTAHPSDPLPADDLDAELNNIATFSSEVCANLALIQRDDGQLANNSVGAEQLQADLNLGLNPTANWLTATAYIPGNGVYHGNNVYRCLIAHTSGVFATDLAALKWELILNLDQFLTPAAASAAAAAADVVLTHADVVLTHADVVLTHADVIAAAASAAAAALNANFYAATVGGTGDAITASVSTGGYSAGQIYRVKFGASNTVTGPTINFDSKGAKTIKKMASGGKAALAVGDLFSGLIAELLYDGTDMVLLAPLTGQSMSTTLGSASATTTTYADITGSTLNLVAGATYRFALIADIACGDGGGGKIGTAGTATYTAYSLGTRYGGGNSYPYNDTDNGHNYQTNAPGTLFSDFGASFYKIITQGVLVVNAGGTIKLQFGENNSTAGPQTLSNCLLTLTRIA